MTASPITWYQRYQGRLKPFWIFIPFKIASYISLQEFVETVSGLSFFPAFARSSEEFREVNPDSLKEPTAESRALVFPPGYGGLRNYRNGNSYTDLCSISKCTLPAPEFWTVPKDRKEELQQTLLNFQNSSGEKRLEMPSTLSPAERKWIHQVAENLDLEHFSQGPPSQRLLVIEKKDELQPHAIDITKMDRS